MTRSLSKAVFIAAMVGVSNPAWGDCDRAAFYAEPTCALVYGSFETEDDFRYCLHIYTRFMSEAQPYLSCDREDVDEVLELVEKYRRFMQCHQNPEPGCWAALKTRYGDLD